MALITKTFSADEKSWQTEFYKHLFGEDLMGITIDRSTDGYTRGIIFEQKTNLQSYGESKALGQALIYLSRFNRDGVPVPAKICLVGQEDKKCYMYNTQNYMQIIADIPKYANMKASDGIPGFVAGAPNKIITFDMETARGMQDILNFVSLPPETVKVDINVHNVYGWAMYYYDHATEFKQKAEKKKFFEELRNPVGTLEAFINPWTGQESDFKYIMDILNDPATQKDLGAFYTPPLYAKKATELVKQAIARIPEGNDYVIIDRCAGTGNLEMYFDEEMLSHTILSTYELKEWMVLKDRYHGRVRYIIPPVPTTGVLPELNSEGFLTGANALTREIITNPEVRKYLDDPNCNIIMYENPPFVESTEVVKSSGQTIVQKKKATWKQFELAQEMGAAVPGVASNDMGNVFIWSAFKYFLKSQDDSYIAFSPIKYWKAHRLIEKKFLGGYAFNRKHFHADATCVTCILWSNQDDAVTHSIKLDAFDIENGALKEENPITVKQVFSTFSDVYFDKRSFPGDMKSELVCEINGTPCNKKPVGLTPVDNPNILGYLVAYKNTFESPRYCAMLLRGGVYNGHGFYLRADNFVEKLPMFAAAKYTDNCNGWRIMSMVMKSGDGAAQYEHDVATGRLNAFLCQTLIWSCLSHYAHMRTLSLPTGILSNELCFDNLNGKPTVASEKLDEFMKNGYNLTDADKALLAKWNEILAHVAKTSEYNPDFKYGLYQIDEDINIKVQQGVKKDGTPNMVTKYGDLNNLIKEMKGLLKQYYVENIAPVLFEYEFLK